MAADRKRTRLLPRLLCASLGLGVAMAGFALVLTVFLAFLGLPLFVLGMAVMQSQAE